IPVRIDDLVIEQVQEAFESGGLTASIVPGAGDRPGSANITERENSRFNARFSYTGRLSGLLDLMSTRFNLWWRYSEGTIVFYEMDTRVFTVFALPTITNVNTRIGGSGNDGGTGGGGSVGSASNQMATRVDFDMWKQIEQSISGILPGNATFTISPSSGQITVTAPPSSLRKVARYVNDLNLRLSRQVVIGVQLLSITMTENDHYGLDLNAIFSQNGLTAGFSSGFNSAWNPATGGETGGLGVTIVGGSSRRLNKLAGSRAIIEALSTQGKTSLVTSTSVTTLNNRVAPVQVSLVRPYVDSMGTVVSDGIASTTITQAQLNLGFTMQILPRILDHGRLMLSFSITLTELLEMEDFRFGFEGRDRVQQPHVDSRAFSQEVAMMSGQTLVLTGFERVDSSTNRSGIGNARNTLLGGRAYTERERVVMAILITPEVVVSPLSPETRVADMF
ncbi:MAG: hypothetical protein FWF01_00970, partial [Alphaproteobacteria bacterium]|nr:hypothetical protein [Alphaproteobacteria bacterium]